MSPLDLLAWSGAALAALVVIVCFVVVAWFVVDLIRNGGNRS